MNNFVANILEVVPGSMADYERLSRYHYLPEKLGPVTDIQKIVARKPHRKSFPDPVAICIFRMPLPDLRARTKATNGYFHTPETRSERLKLVNQNMRYAARIIVDPRFRRLGIATKLLLEMLAKQTIPIIETLTPLDFTNQWLQKTGFELYYTPAPPWYRRFTATLYTIGLTPDDMLLPVTFKRRVERLPGKVREFAEYEIQRFLQHFPRHHDMPPGIERAKFIRSKIPFPEAYLIWFNPHIAHNPIREWINNPKVKLDINLGYVPITQTA